MIYHLKKKKKIELAENLALCLQPPARIDGLLDLVGQAVCCAFLMSLISFP